MKRASKAGKLMKAKAKARAGKGNSYSPGKASVAKATPAPRKTVPPSYKGGSQNVSGKPGQSPNPAELVEWEPAPEGNDVQNDSAGPYPAKSYLAAGWSIDELIAFAEGGDAEAARYLHDLAIRTTRAIYSLCCANPGAAEAMKQPQAPWPLLDEDLKVNDDGYLTVPKDHLLRKLRVILRGRTIDDSAPGTKAALMIYRIMDTYRRGARTLTTKREREIQKLLPLSEASLPDWWKLAQPFIEEWWSAEFQDHADFDGWKTKSYKNLIVKAARVKKRGDIVKAIKQGLRSVARSLRIDHPG